MPSNPHKHLARAQAHAVHRINLRDCAEQAAEAVLDGASAAAAALPAADCAACCDGAAHGEAAQFFSPGAELASHLVRHWCVTTTRSTRFMLHVCSPSLWLCCEVSSVHSGAVPSHAMDPANAFTFHGAVGDGRALFGSMRGERPQANKAHPSSAPSPWALPGGGSDACAPAVDLAALMQLTAWIKALGELIRMQDEKDSRLVDLRARAVAVLDAWAQRWYDGQAISTP